MLKSSAAREARLFFYSVVGLLLDAVSEIARIAETGDNI